MTEAEPAASAEAPDGILARVLDLAGSALPALLLAVVLVTVSADVVLRTVFAAPLQEAHDIAILAFAGTVWFGVVGAMLHGETIGVQLLVDRLPPRARKGALVLSHLAVIAIAVMVARAAWAHVATSRFTTFLALGWPKWIVSAMLGAAMASVVMAQILMILKALRVRA